MPIPWMMLAQLGTQIVGSLSGGRDQKKYQQEQARKTARANLASSLSQGRFQPQVSDTGPKQSLLTRLAGAADTGLQVADAFKQAGRADEMYGLQKRSMEQGLEQGAQQLRQMGNADAVEKGSLLASMADLNPEVGSNPDGLQLKRAPAYRAFADRLPGEGPDGPENLYTEAAYKSGVEGRQAQQSQAISQQEQATFDRMAKMFDLDLKGRGANLEEQKFDFDKEKFGTENRLAYAKLAGEQAAKSASGGEDRTEQFTKILTAVEKLPGVNKLSDFRTSYGNLHAVLDQIKATGSNGVLQVAALNSFQKLVDPATVHLGDVEMYKSAQSFFDQLALQGEKVGDSILINKDMVDQMDQASKAMMTVYRHQIEDQLSGFVDGAVSYGADRNVLTVPMLSKVLGIGGMGQQASDQPAPRGNPPPGIVQTYQNLDAALQGGQTALGRIGRAGKSGWRANR